ncbi:MAG: hypothetical protein V7739_05055 [Motiliproteus sp.]
MFLNEANKKRAFYIELPAVASRRGAFRIEPDEKMPAVLLIEGATADIQNLSSSGIAFYLGDILKPDIHRGNQFNAIPLYLGGAGNEFILIDIEVLHQQDNLYRCRMSAKDHAGQMALCRYIVERQKADIRGQVITNPRAQE